MLVKARAGQRQLPVSRAITTTVDVHWSANTKKMSSESAVARL
jgi:hypothetical protein